MLTSRKDGCFKVKSTSKKLFCALWLAAWALTLPSEAATDMFLDLGADIPGESKDPSHLNQVDVLAWSWGMSNSGTTHVGGGTGVGKANFQDLSLTKYVDKASPKLMLQCAKGALIPTVTLFVRKSGLNAEYIKITLSNVLVSSVSTGGSSGEDRLTENVTLNFSVVTFDYVPTKPDGTAGETVSFSWDIAGNIQPN